jgi:hypothetical protein
MKYHPHALAHFLLPVLFFAFSPWVIAQVSTKHIPDRAHASHTANANAILAAPVSYAAGFGDASLSVAGDFNGDGAADIAVVDPCADSNCGLGYASMSVLLNAGNGTFRAPVTYATGTFEPMAIAVGDFNGDGVPDLAVASQCGSSLTCGTGAVTLFLGNGDGSFQAPVTYSSGPGSSYFVATADFNGDGKLDLAVANQTGSNSNVMILLGNGDGTFQAPASYSTAATSAVFMAVGDFNNDGAPDLAVVNGTTQDSVSILLGNGDGTFQSAVLMSSGGAFPKSVAVADLNGDGIPDLAVANGCATDTNLACSSDGAVAVLLGNGDGTFQAPVSYDSAGNQANFVAVGDFNGDGVPDLAVANLASSAGGSSAGVLSLLLGNGDGTFQSAVTYASGGNYALAASVADFNGDGQPDVAVVNACNSGLICTGGTVGVLLNSSPTPFLYANAISLTSSVNPANLNQSVVLTAAVSPDFNAGTPTGAVTFYNGAEALSSVPLSGGQASLTTSFPSPGPQALTAIYSGDSNYAGGSSPAISQVVGSPVTLSSSANPSTYGQSVTLTATVTSTLGRPTGTVQFLDGATSLGTFSLSNGSASVSTSSLSAGIHSITASYSGTAKYPAGSAVLTQAVGQAATVALAANPNPATTNQSVSLTATVTGQYGGTPTGAVAFMQGSPATTWATAPLIGGQATVTNAFNKAGTYPVTAVYLGSPGYQTNSSTILNETVNTSPDVRTTTALSTSGSPSTINQPVTFTAVVTPTSGSIPNGETVTFYDGGNAIGTGATAADTAVFTTSSLAVGSHAITATYAGDGTYESSTSHPVTQVVQLESSTTTLSSSLNPATYGQSITFTVTVAPLSGTGTPTGKVTLSNGSNTIASVTLSNGTGTYTTSTLAAGTLPMSASYGGDSTFGASSASLTQTINVASTTTVLSSSPNPASINQTVTFTATVTGQYGGTLGGTVTVMQGSTVLGSAAPVRGKATVTSAFAAAGTYSVTASYSGDSNDAPSTSSAITQTIGEVSTTTTLVSSGTPSYIGQNVTFTATVAPTSGAIPNGETVTFYDGSVSLGSGSTANGIATFATSSLAVGTHSITATYAGDAIYQTSTSKVVKQVVNLNTSNTSLVSSQNPAGYGQSVTLTATVTAGSGTLTPTGKVNFKNGTTVLSSVTLVNGVAAYTSATLAAGSLSLTASYAGDSNFAASSASLTQVVNLAVTTTALSASPNPSSLNQSVTLTATVTAQYGGTLTGTVAFMQGSKTLGSSALSKGKATFSQTFTSAGTDALTAVYSGDANNQASTSPVWDQTVTNAVTTTTLATSANPADVGQTVTFTATVTSAFGTIPNGDLVTFYDGSSVIGTGNTEGGVAALAISTLASGTHSITATYAGDSSFESSTSKAISETIKTNPTTTVITSNLNPASYGAPVTFTATVTSAGPTPTGTVTFKNGGTPLGTASLNAQGATTFTTVTLGAGSYSITASYSGDSASAASTSAAFNETITLAATTTQLIASVNPVAAGSSVTFTALVRCATAEPTGTVTFSAGSTVLGTASIASGSAKLSTSALPMGSSMVTATYAGSANLAGSSGSVVEIVN